MGEAAGKWREGSCTEDAEECFAVLTALGFVYCAGGREWGGPALWGSWGWFAVRLVWRVLFDSLFYWQFGSVLLAV